MNEVANYSLKAKILTFGQPDTGHVSFGCPTIEMF